MKRTAADILGEASDTYRQRNAVYGDNFLQVGAVMQAMFPDGMKLATEEDHNRMHLFYLVVVKLTRYRANIFNGGHQDSARDMAVYAAMLEAYDGQVAAAKKLTFSAAGVEAFNELEPHLKAAVTRSERAHPWDRRGEPYHGPMKPK